MPKFRYAVLENDKAITSTTTSGTETIDLPERGILTGVTSQVRHKGVYADNSYLPDFHALKKVELLVDGSTVVKSLNGRQARALMWYRGGPFSTTNNYEAAGNSNKVYSTFPLYLGRSVNDTKYGLDLSQYSNPQLKLEWDVSATSFDGITYDANATDPSFTYNIMAKVLDGTPDGFTNNYIQSREIDSWTVAAGAEHGTEIPRGYPLYGVMIGSRYTSVAWFDLINHVKLDFDNGKWLPIDMDYENLAAAHKEWWPNPVEVNHWFDCANGDDYDTQVMQIAAMGHVPASSSVGEISWEVFEFPLYTVGRWQPDGTALTSKAPVHMNVTGWGPHQTIYIPMSQMLDGSMEAIPTTDYGRIDLKVSTSASSGTSAVSRVVAEYIKPNGE